MWSHKATLDKTQCSVNLLSVSFLFCLVIIPISGQTQRDPDGIKVTHSPSQLTLQVSTARPLWAASRAISNELGWTVDYEETAMSPADVEDIAPAEWKSAHPFQPGILVPKGENLLISIPRTQGLREDKDKDGVMQSLVGSSLPNIKNRFRSFQSEPDGRETIIDAQSAELKSIGSYEISEEAGTVSGMVDVTDIVARCSTASGHKLSLGVIPVNLLAQMTFQRRGGQVTCRAALSQLLDEASYKLIYSIIFNPQNGEFVLNIEPVKQTTTSPSGELRSVFIRNLKP